MNKIIKIPSSSFTDGYINFGNYDVLEDEQGNALEKQFNSLDRVPFSKERYRERDKFNFDTKEISIDLKISIPLHRSIRSNHKIQIGEILFSIEHLDIDKLRQKVYLYLTELKDILDTKINIIRVTTNSKFEPPTESLLKTVFANIQKINIDQSKLANKAEYINSYTIIVKKNNFFEELEKNGLLNELLIGFENRKLMINHINIKSAENGLYELLTQEV